MTSHTEFVPHRAVHPGNVLQGELESRDLKQKDLAEQLGIAPSQLNEIIKGKRPISAELAVLLEAALDIEAEVWNNLQAKYNLDQARIQKHVTERSDFILQWKSVIELIPVKFFKKAGVITGVLIEDLRRIYDIFSISNASELQQNLSIGGVQGLHYKRSGKLKTHVENMKAWVAYVKYRAREVKANRFTPAAQEEVIRSVRRVFLGKDILKHLEVTLSTHGIKLVVQEKPDHAPIDGAAFCVGENPVVALTLRHKRLDNLVFTVLHELGHVFLHLRDNPAISYVDNTMEDSKGISTDFESEANEFAGNLIIPPAEWEQFVEANDFGDYAVKKFASRIGTPASSIRGRLCFEELIPYNSYTTISNKIT